MESDGVGVHERLLGEVVPTKSVHTSHPQPQRDINLKSQEHNITLCLCTSSTHIIIIMRTKKELGMKNTLTTKNGSIGLNIRNVDFLLNSHYSDQVLNERD